MTYNDFFTLKNVTCKGLITGTRKGGDAQLALPTQLSWHRSPDPPALPSVLAWAGKGWHRAAHLKTLWSCLFFSPHFFAVAFAQGPRSSLWSPSRCHTPRMHIYTASRSTAPLLAQLPSTRNTGFGNVRKNPVFFTLEVLHMLFCLGHCSAFVHKCLMTFFKKQRKSLYKKAYISMDLCLKDSISKEK